MKPITMVCNIVEIACANWWIGSLASMDRCLSLGSMQLRTIWYVENKTKVDMILILWYDLLVPYVFFWPMQTQSCTPWFSPHVIYTDTHLHTFTVHRSFQIHLNARSSEQIPANLDCAKVYTIRFSGYISIYSNTPISTSQSNGM